MTESPATVEEDISTELLGTEISYRKTVEHTKNVLATYRLENRCPHKLFDLFCCIPHNTLVHPFRWSIIR